MPILPNFQILYNLLMKITVVGGGTGTSVVLEGLREYPDLELSVIVSMMDDGGSNATVRDDFGLLPLSDLRKSIIALGDKDKNHILRELFLYRFSKSNGLSGHTLGNLMMIALSEISSGEVGAIENVRELFGIKGHILPVTLDDVRLVAKYDDGSSVVGEHHIDEPKEDKKIVKLSLNSKARAYKGAVDAILESDYVVIGPGDLYTSTIANIIIPGISNALQKTSAKLIFISNLMSKKGETRHMTQKDLLETIEKYVGRRMDYVLINNQKFPSEIVKRYHSDGEHEFVDNLKERSGRKIIRRDLIAKEEVKRSKGDTLKRSLIRHDPDKLSNELYAIFRKSPLDVLSRLISDITWPWL